MNNEELIARIEKLEKWKADRERQQIFFPLDIQSLKILQDKFMRITETIDYEAGAAMSPFRVFIGKQSDLEFEVYPVSLIQYSVNITTNYLNVINTTWRKFFDDDEVTLQTTGTAPAPLSAGLGISYYVINSTDAYRTFQLSTSAKKTVSSIDTGADTITTSTTFFVDNDIVVVSSTGTIPSPFSANTSYYVVGASGATFQLSATLGGGAINITSSGTGTVSVQMAPIDITNGGSGRQFIE